MLLQRFCDSDSIFKAYLPCRSEYGVPVTINLAMWNSNYYRYSQVSSHMRKDSLQFRQVYLRYQDVPCNVIFEIDDSAITENGFSSDPSELTDNTLTLTDVNPLYVKTYSQGDSRFAVAFGQCFKWLGLGTSY